MSWDEAFNWAIKMHPDELQNMGWGWVNPLPQNGQELKKAFKDGAVEATEFYKNAATKIYDDFKLKPPLGLITRGLGIPASWMLPLILQGSTKPETTEKAD